MVEMQTHSPVAALTSAKSPPALHAALPSSTAAAAASPPTAAAAHMSSSVSSPPTALPHMPTSRIRQPLILDTYVSPVNQNGSFEFDRVIKSGYVQRRTQKTKTWRTIFLVLRPNTLSIYKTDKEDKLRHKIFTSELTAVTFLRDPKHKRQHLFGLFSPSQNYYFQANSAKDAQDWVESIRTEARIEEEEEEMFLASPVVRRQSYGFTNLFHSCGADLNPCSPAPVSNLPEPVSEHERLASSSPEPQMLPTRRLSAQQQQHPYNQNHPDTAAWSGNELGLSDYSDGDVQNRLPGMSSESLAAQSPPPTSSVLPAQAAAEPRHSSTDMRNVSQTSGLGNLETDPDRVIWQGWLWLLRSKGGVRQWKDSWAVLRPRNLILYKDESEYAAQLIVPLSSIVNVVERDPLSRTKKHCLQIITEEKSYRFSAHDEETLVHCLGAFKSLLTKRRGLEIRAAAAAAAAATSAANPASAAPVTTADAVSACGTAPANSAFAAASASAAVAITS